MSNWWLRLHAESYLYYSVLIWSENWAFPFDLDQGEESTHGVVEYLSNFVSFLLQFHFVIWGTISDFFESEIDKFNIFVALKKSKLAIYKGI